MLLRLEGAMARNDLIEQMVLLPEPPSAAAKWASSTEAINLVVGYNASPNSQTALDLTMWIAHQTRLVTQKQVTVQVVYVLEDNQYNDCPDVLSSADVNRSLMHRLPSAYPKTLVSKRSITPVSTQPKTQGLAVAKKKKSGKQRRPKKTSFSQYDSFEQADRILWQARCLAEEWRGSFKAHLRFGDVATELKEVVEAESATLLYLGCSSVNHSLVQKLGSDFPCSVLGIPTGLNWDKGICVPSDCMSI
jgi:hypothetical protein